MGRKTKDPGSDRRFPLLRYFSIGSLLVIGAVALVLSAMVGEQSTKKLVSYAEKNNLVLTQVLSNTIWPNWQRFAPKAAKLSRTELSLHPDFKKFDQLVRSSVSRTSILKIKLFDLSGEVRYSTEHGQIGDRKPGYKGVVEARKGSILSELKFKDTFNGIDGPLENRYVVSSYLPIRPGDSKTPVGIFEVYFDVTSLYEDMVLTNQNLVLKTVLILLLAYGALFFIVRSAGLKLDRYYKENRRQYLEAAERNKLLEELTSQLRDTRDEAMAADQIKTAFLANMSHELRTPLNAIIGYSEMLMEDATNDKGDLERINRSGKHLLRLINQILDITKIESGQMETRIEEFDLVYLLDDVVSTLHPMMSKKGNRIDVTISEIDIAMESDQTKVRQVLLNLLANANKFTSDGTIELKIATVFRDETRYIDISVIDTGIGMSKEDLGKLFTPFVQVGNKQHEGTGLGLAISKQLVFHLGGNIEVQSELGVGTTFELQIPARMPEDKSQGAA